MMEELTEGFEQRKIDIESILVNSRSDRKVNGSGL